MKTVTHNRKVHTAELELLYLSIGDVKANNIFSGCFFLAVIKLYDVNICSILIDLSTTVSLYDVYFCDKRSRMLTRHTAGR